MPRKSIYFTDELLPRALAAAELDDRSLSAWTMLAVEARLAATGRGVFATEEERAEIISALEDRMAPTSVPDTDVLRAASAPTGDGPVFAKYVKNAAGRQVPVSTAGEIIKAEQLEAAKRKAQS